MTPLPLLAPGTDIDEEGNWELLPTLPPDGSPPLTSNPPGSLVDIDLETGRSSKSDVLLDAEALHWTIE